MTLYRKYRPQQFQELLGQEAVNTTLQQALRQERTTHAYLFSGPRGTGKTSSARIFARAMVCLEPKQTNTTFEPCNKCLNCQLVLKNQTIDILEIDAASNRGVEDIRELREQVNYRPSQLKKKVYIIDEVHMLTNEAFNALLKTLEEPPEYCLFILATTELHKVPLTIRSRCQLLRFDKGSLSAIETALEKVSKAEKLEVEPAVYSLLAKHADGGFRDALSLLETISTQSSPVTLEKTEQALGIINAEQIQQLISSVLTQDLSSTSQILQRYSLVVSGSGEALLVQIINQLRDIIYSQQTGQPTEAWAEQLAKQVSPSLLTQALEQFLEAYILQRSTPLATLPLEIACFSICQYEGEKKEISPQLSLVSHEHRPSEYRESKPENKNHSSSVVKIVTSTPIENAPVPVIELRQESTRDPRQAWKQMIEKVCQENMVLGQALKQAVFHKAENDVITIHVRYKFHADKMNEAKNKDLIYSLMRQLTDINWQIEYLVSSTAVPKHKPSKELGTGVADAVAIFGTPPIP